MPIEQVIQRMRGGCFHLTAHNLSTKQNVFSTFNQSHWTLLFHLMWSRDSKSFKRVFTFLFLLNMKIIIPSLHHTNSLRGDKPCSFVQKVCIQSFSANNVNYLTSLFKTVNGTLGFMKIIIILLLFMSGDVHPNPGPKHSNKELSVVHVNARSIAKKIDLLEAEISTFDIITLSETWLHPNISNDKLSIKNFQQPIRLDRDTGPWGGVAVYVKNNLPSKHRTDLHLPGL